MRLVLPALFPLFSKIDVNGKNADPLFVYLKAQQGGFLGFRDSYANAEEDGKGWMDNEEEV